MYSDKFLKLMPVILKHEGGFVNDATDPGGATNFGVSLRFLSQTGDLSIGDLDHDGDIDYFDIQKMTVDDAMVIYNKYFYKPEYEEIPDLKLTEKVFDFAVNMGHKQAVTLLQRAIKACGIPEIVDDGSYGPRTAAAVKSLCLAGSNDALVAGIRSEAAAFYRVLIAQTPKFEKYRSGWLRRAYE